MKLISQQDFISKFKDKGDMREFVSGLNKKDYTLLHPSNIYEDPMNYSNEPQVITPSSGTHSIRNIERFFEKTKLEAGNNKQIELINSYALYLVEDYLYSHESYFPESDEKY